MSDVNVDKEVKVREVNMDKDINFLYNSYLKSFRGALMNKKVSNTVYYKNEQKILTDYMQNPDCSLLVACNPSDENQIYGYVFFNKKENSIWWVYVKETFRRCGIFKKLLLESGLDVLKPIIYRHDSFAFAQVVNNLKDSISFIYIPFYYDLD